ncbi:MAG: VOC family protein [bacterium]|nr:VOC family protein [bacterium]
MSEVILRSFYLLKLNIFQLGFDSQIIFLKVNDLNVSSDFYIKNFGFELVLDQGKCRIFRAPGKSCIGFCQGRTKEVDKNVVLTFVTDEVDEIYIKLRNENVIVIKEPGVNKEFRIYNCFVEDPDGYVLEIQKFLDVKWNETKLKFDLINNL